MMNRSRENHEGSGRGGIRLNRLNVLMICAGLALAVLMVISMYRITGSVRNIVTATGNYLDNQQTGGMLRDFTGSMSEQAKAFVQSGDPGSARAYEGQMNSINARLEQYMPETFNSEEAGAALLRAVEAFRARGAEEKRAMRLAAATLPAPAFEVLPAFLKETELSAEDAALTDAEKKEAAARLLDAEQYIRNGETVKTAVDESHRLSSVEGQEQAADTFARVKGIVAKQAVLVALIIILAVLALVLNRLLIIAPIQKSVEKLDRREPIPVRGSYEMRHLARVYNDVLQDNKEKTEALSYTASHDALTGVYNRDAFDRLYREIKKKEHYGLVMLDVDHFKQYNDEFGHDVGDRVLCTAVEAMKRHFRGEDHISRIGGDEFCIIMPGADQNQAGTVKDKIVQINRELADTCSDLPPVTVSAGIAFWDRPDPAGSLLKDADTMLLDLKKTRDVCCAVYGENPAISF